jgi:hypothetical protein
MRLGHGQRRSVLILWAWTAVLSVFVLFPLFIPRVNAFIPLGAGVLGAGLYTLFHPGLRRREAEMPAAASPAGVNGSYPAGVAASGVNGQPPDAGAMGGPVERLVVGPAPPPGEASGGQRQRGG